jgi:excisionase family DNA binding protein
MSACEREREARPEELQFVGEAAKPWRIHPRHLWAAIRTGELIAYRIGDRWRVRPSDVVRWLEERRSR